MHQRIERNNAQVNKHSEWRLDKLTNITQNLENKLNGIQKMMVEDENKLNHLEEEKEQLRDEMVQKTILLVFQLDRQEQYTRRENILTYGVEENKKDNDDGEKVLFKIADELQIDLEYNQLQQWFPNFFWSRTICGSRTVSTYHLVAGRVNVPNIIRSKVWKTRIDTISTWTK